jgi:hypothetical protein
MPLHQLQHNQVRQRQLPLHQLLQQHNLSFAHWHRRLQHRLTQLQSQCQLW